MYEKPGALKTEGYDFRNGSGNKMPGAEGDLPAGFRADAEPVPFHRVLREINPFRGGFTGKSGKGIGRQGEARAKIFQPAFLAGPKACKSEGGVGFPLDPGELPRLKTDGGDLRRKRGQRFRCGTG